MKDLKQSTNQRFGGFKFDSSSKDIEADIVSKETGIDLAIAEKLVQIAQCSRNLKGYGLDEGISTRLLVYAAQLINTGEDTKKAYMMAQPYH